MSRSFFMPVLSSGIINFSESSKLPFLKKTYGSLSTRYFGKNNHFNKQN
ncbi:MAG: hypothetical protein ACRC77_12420 [Bacteroidales bacterium]